MVGLVATLLFIGALCVVASPKAQQSNGFVSRNGSVLLLDGKPFRFGGCNMYWLGLDQNDPPGVIAYPSHFRVDDALNTAVLMGASVIRAHTLGISTGNHLSFEPKLDKWNVRALEPIDYAVHRAEQLGLKLIVPLTDNYHYYHGGKHDFTDWLGVPESDFYNDTKVVRAFESYIFHLLNHTNQYTGRRYADEPAILAWETGNELMPPPNWTKAIAKFIKSVSPNHLVLSGRFGVSLEELPFPEVDLYSDHFYPMNNLRPMLDAALTLAANKAFVVGEFGWPDGNLTEFLDVMSKTRGINGDLYWSFFPHLGSYGFEQHDDGFTLHYPGDTDFMFDRRRQLEHHAYSMRGRVQPPAYNVTKPPKLHPVNSTRIFWRGSWGSCRYHVEKRASGQGERFKVFLSNVTDNDVPVVDPTQAPNTTYRVVPVSCSGSLGAQSNEEVFRG